jgi:hypothetical protein
VLPDTFSGLKNNCEYHGLLRVESCLRESNIDQQTIAKLKAIFGEDNVATNPLHNLETTMQQLAYFETEFQLKVRY